MSFPAVTLLPAFSIYRWNQCLPLIIFCMTERQLETLCHLLTIHHSCSWQNHSPVQHFEQGFENYGIVYIHSHVIFSGVDKFLSYSLLDCGFSSFKLEFLLHTFISIQRCRAYSLEEYCLLLITDLSLLSFLYFCWESTKIAVIKKGHTIVNKVVFSLRSRCSPRILWSVVTFLCYVVQSSN